jgi:hypothetical protein
MVRLLALIVILFGVVAEACPLSVFAPVVRAQSTTDQKQNPEDQKQKTEDQKQNTTKRGQGSTVGALLLAGGLIRQGAALAPLAPASNEDFVLANLKEGKWSDFSLRPNKELPSDFVKYLLFDLPPQKQLSKFIGIRGATITGDLEVSPLSRSVPTDAVFQDCHFTGVFDLGFSRFDSDLTFGNSTFDKPITLFNAEVKGNLAFYNDTFQSLWLQRVQIGNQLTLYAPKSNAIFIGGSSTKSLLLLAEKDQTAIVMMTQLKAEEVTIGSVWSQSPSLPSLNELLDHLDDPGRFLPENQQPAEIKSLILAAASISGNVYVADIRIKELDLSSSHIGGITMLGPRLQIESSLDLSQSRQSIFQWLRGREQWPKTVAVAEMSFDDLSVSHSVGGAEENIDFFRQAQGVEVPLARYESILRNMGLVGPANDAYALIRTKRRSENFGSAVTFEQKLGAYLFAVLDLIQKNLLGYGKFPGPPLVWSAFFVLLGFFLFRNRSHMTASKENLSGERYSAFWYSLELFLPVVDLGVAKAWRPNVQRKDLQLYARLHQIAGWILIPTVLAALTGAIK